MSNSPQPGHTLPHAPQSQLVEESSSVVVLKLGDISSFGLIRLRLGSDCGTGATLSEGWLINEKPITSQSSKPGAHGNVQRPFVHEAWVWKSGVGVHTCGLNGDGEGDGALVITS